MQQLLSGKQTCIKGLPFIDHLWHGTGVKIGFHCRFHIVFIQNFMAQRCSNHDALTKASGASTILVADQTRIQGPWKGKTRICASKCNNIQQTFFTCVSLHFTVFHCVSFYFFHCELLIFLIFQCQGRHCTAISLKFADIQTVQTHPIRD